MKYSTKKEESHACMSYPERENARRENVKTYRDLIALIVAGVLFCGGVSLASGIDHNPVQAIPACIMLGAAAFISVATDRKRHDREQTIQAHKAARKANRAA